jgi:hypothetical protein
MMWAMRVGPRALALDWEEEGAMQMFRRVKKEYLSRTAQIAGHKMAVNNFAKDLWAPQLRIQGLIADDNATKEQEVGLCV